MSSKLWILSTTSLSKVQATLRGTALAIAFLDGTLPNIPTNVCGLSVEFDESGSCVFGAPFSTAVFAAFHDDKKQTSLAQGDVSTGAAM